MDALRKILPYTSILVLVALGYAAWVFWSRHAENRRLQEQSQAEEAGRAPKSSTNSARAA